MTDLFIIAAGNGTRLGRIGVPKALMPINGIPNLINTIQIAQDLFKNIFIVISDQSQHHFEDALLDFKNEYGETFAENIILVPIRSGKGSGHAVLEGLIEAQKYGKVSSNSLITWGDAYYFNQDLLKETIDLQMPCPMVIPVKYEEKPYLAFKLDDDSFCSRADFSQPDYGFHDQSLFKVNVNNLISALKDLHDVLWDTDHYTSDVGELNFMNVVQYYKNKGIPAKAHITNHFVMGYNTLNEVRDIENRLTGQN